MEINNGESFIPDIIPPELREPEPPLSPSPTATTKTTASGSFTVLPAPKSEKAVVAPPPFYIHHTIVGLGIAGASMLVFLIPELKPTTKVAVAAMGVSIGALLVYDDLQSHWESGCDIKTIFDFVPCQTKITVVKKP